VKTAPLKVSPGSQFFVEENAFVDTLGRLHLRLSRCQDSWCAAEVFTKDTVGYGKYTFQIDSELDTLDPNITLGIFTWDAIASDQFHSEWDIEFARWGTPNASFSAQYVVQPYTGPNNMLRFLMSSAAPTTHTVNWSQSQVNFASNAGTIGATANQPVHIQRRPDASTATWRCPAAPELICWKWSSAPGSGKYRNHNQPSSIHAGRRSDWVLKDKRFCSGFVQCFFGSARWCCGMFRNRRVR